MGRWARGISTIGGGRLIGAVGRLYVVLAVARALLIVATGGAIGAILVDFVLLAAPGLAVLYGGYRLPRTGIHPDVHPRIAGWIFGGFGVMLGVVVLLVLNPAGSVDHPIRAGVIATAFGSVGGLAIGTNEARAITRAYETEQRNQELTRYETLIQEATDVNAIFDRDGTFQYLTPSVEHVLGYAPDELVGEEVFEYVHPDDRQKAMSQFTETIEQGRSQLFEFRFEHSDGSWVVLEGTGRNLLDDPMIEGVVAYTHDITERKQLENDLRQERDLRERIVETSPIGIVVVDAEGIVSFANEHAAQIVGLSTDELTDVRYDEPMFSPTDAEGNPVEDGVFQQILATGDAAYDVERQITRADGGRIWLSVNGAPITDSAGDVTSVVFALEDITERKQLEEELRDTVADLEESNERLEQFAWIASHDLQEPLRMVSSYLQLLEDRYRDDLDSDAQEFIEFAVGGADRMREMVSDLLAYSRLDTHDTTLEPTDCEAVLDRVLVDLQVKIEESNAEITADSLPTVVADETQLEQLFQNLISNAIKYSGDTPPHIELTAEQRDGHWEFAVADDGIGIDSAHTDRIFEVFKRLHGNEAYPGTGIGLPLCQKIVESHGGEIWVESEPGEGATFYFTLPTKMKEHDRAPQRRSDRHPSGRG